jgi:hypothetical protein
MIRARDGTEARSGSDGHFTLPLPRPDSLLDVTVTSSSTVDRATYLRVAGEPAMLQLMPRSLSLGAFDQMFRGNGGELHRWTTAPAIVVERRVLQFTGVDRDRYTAAADMMSDADLASLLDDLTWALPQLTGGTYQDFAQVVVETSGIGTDVGVNRPGIIVVARYEGLSAASGFWGYTRWAWNGRGEMRAATVMLDQAFETSGSGYRRSLRAHELGHALGYNHVDVRDSVMNSSARILPNSFDRHGSRIAFLRPPLNRSPDVDPDPMTVSRRPAAGLTWTGAH